MSRKFLFMLILVSLVFLSSLQAFGQRRIIEYPSRLKSRQNYSYYKYRRRVISYPVSGVPYNRQTYRRRPINPYQYAAYGNPVRYVQNSATPRQQVFEEEIREEFRTWGEPSGSPVEFGSYRIEALEREISDMKIMLRDISRKIDSSI